MESAASALQEDGNPYVQYFGLDRTAASHPEEGLEVYAEAARRRRMSTKVGRGTGKFAKCNSQPGAIRRRNFQPEAATRKGP